MEFAKKKKGSKGGRGCKILISVLLALNTLSLGMAFAQDDISISTGIIGNGKNLGAKTIDGQLTVPVLGINASGNTQLNANSGAAAVLAVAKTPVQSCTSSACTFSQSVDFAAGKSARVSINTVTFKATPTPGTDLLVVGYNLPSGTPTVSTIARLPATPTPGDVVEFYNSWTASLKIQAGGAATINGAGTNGTIVVATLTGVRCIASGTANWDCKLGVNPTPAA